MDLYAAVDVLEGAAVRLTRGDFDRRRHYGDPVELAQRFEAEGAPWLHVVDLDGARTGRPANRDVVERIVAAVHVPVQSGGGVRTTDDVRALLDVGVSRVVLGTTAVEDPGAARAVVAAFPERVGIGLDYRRGDDGRLEAAARGWLTSAGRTVEELLDALADVGVAAVVATAIDRDGTLGGPDLDGLGRVLAATSIPVIASGGVSSAADLQALAAVELDAALGTGGTETRRLVGVVTGRALVDGRLTVSEGVTACARSG